MSLDEFDKDIEYFERSILKEVFKEVLNEEDGSSVNPLRLTAFTTALMRLVLPSVVLIKMSSPALLELLKLDPPASEFLLSLAERFKDRTTFAKLEELSNTIVDGLNGLITELNPVKGEGIESSNLH